MSIAPGAFARRVALTAATDHPAVGDPMGLRVLLVEDSADDALLVELELRRGGVDLATRRVDNAPEMRAALADGTWDAVISDYALPGFSGLQALRLVHDSGMDLPFIFVSGQMGEDIAVEAMRLGAQDYLTKGHLKRLAPALLREVRDARIRHTARESESRRHSTEARLAEVLRIAADAIISTDAAQRITLFNVGAEKIFGYQANEVLGQPLEMLIPARYAQAHRKHVDDFGASTDAARPMGQRNELFGRRKDGTEFPAEATISRLEIDGERTYTAFLRDITERRAAEERIRFLGHYDALTGLPNRTLFSDRLRQTLLEAGRFGQHVAVLMLNLDRFSAAMATLGAQRTDELLQAVAARLPKSLHPWDTVARLGGDQFGALLPRVERPEAAGRSAQALRLALEQPFWLDGREVYLSATVGIALYPQDGRDAESLLAAAETTLRRAKENNAGYEFHAPELTARARDNLTLESALRRALERRELAVHYQPQVELVSGSVVGFEALLRWTHPELGVIPPVRFVPLLESTGLIVPVGEWVLRTALSQLKQWQQREYLGLRMAVNLSPRQFADPRLVEMVRETARQQKVGPQHVDLEITESLMIQEGSGALAALNALRAIGCQLSVDDFGTGYSSLSYLHRLPVHQLKIDRSFVREIQDADRDSQIVNAILAMARGLHLTVVAEGVETSAQLGNLRRHRCEMAQGHLFSPAVPPDEAEKLLGREVMGRYGTLMRR